MEVKLCWEMGTLRAVLCSVPYVLKGVDTPEMVCVCGKSQFSKLNVGCQATHPFYSQHSQRLLRAVALRVDVAGTHAENNR